MSKNRDSSEFIRCVLPTRNCILSHTQSFSFVLLKCLPFSPFTPCFLVFSCTLFAFNVVFPIVFASSDVSTTGEILAGEQTHHQTQEGEKAMRTNSKVMANS